MPIDMRNMLPGFSSQVMCSTPVKINPNDGLTTTKIAVCPLRETEVLDVGFMVTDSCTAAYAVAFGRTIPSGTDGSANSGYFAQLFTVDADTAVGTVYKISDASLTTGWSSTADTENERRLPKGSFITCLNTDPGADGEFVPFVIMRGAEPLDPIA